MNASVSRKNSLTSQKMTSVCMENYRSGKQLEAELERLEQERRSRLRKLNQESKHFVEFKLKSASARSRDKSPSRGSTFSLLNLSPSHTTNSRSPSISPPKSRSPSPQPLHLRKSLSVEESKKQISPSSSPECQRRLLCKRSPSPNSMVRSLSITEATTVPLSLKDKHIKHSPKGAIKTTEWILRTNAGLIESASSSIPQIVVNDVSAKQSVGKDFSMEKHTTTGGTNNECKLDTTDGSLAVPIRTGRRNSAPSVPLPSAYLQKIAKKESTFITEDIEVDARRSLGRGRSSSVSVPYFNHLKDAPRRDSLIKKYVAKRGSYRRTAVTIEQLISDLAKGVHHSELLNKTYGNSGISLAEWEKLKECRYLRRPSQDDTAVGNTIDVEDIFSSSDKESKQ